MPKSLMDWFGVASLWLGAALLALKSANLPSAMPMPMLTSSAWNAAPLALLTLAMVIMVVRAMRGPQPTASNMVASAPTRTPMKYDDALTFKALGFLFGFILLLIIVGAVIAHWPMPHNPCPASAIR